MKYMHAEDGEFPKNVLAVLEGLEDEPDFVVRVKFGKHIPKDARDEMRGILALGIENELKFQFDPEQAFSSKLQSLMDAVLGK
jgi:hypothetical protein